MLNRQSKAGFTKLGTATTEWVRHDRYVYIIKWSGFRRWLRTLMRLLFTGKIKVEWWVPATRKDKRLRLTGKREW